MIYGSVKRAHISLSVLSVPKNKKTTTKNAKNATFISKEERPMFRVILHKELFRLKHSGNY